MSREIFSKALGASLIVEEGLLDPVEAEFRVLPFMKKHPEFFLGKNVLDIGTGSGIIGLYAARLGAKSVVATDINPTAVACARQNAERLGFKDRFESRLTPPGDMTAYASLQPDETFDVIVGNPPFSLDLETLSNTIWCDRGDLGFSIVAGLENHLARDGIAVLFYGSLFYHQVMVKLARYLGYEVEQQDPDALTPWERDAVFNSYLRLFLERCHLPPDAFRFDWKEEQEKHRPAIEKHMGENGSKGLLIIRRREETKVG